METGPTYYCWHCYGTADRPTGPCPRCGEPVEGPPDLDYPDRLLWTLHHPLHERRVVAVQVLGARRERRAVQPLRALLDEGPDTYLAAEILTALVRICGVGENRDLLDEFALAGPAPARRVARHLLGHHVREGPP
jgi:hypothetical protein